METVLAPYPSTCWIVEWLTSRCLASSRWLTPLNRSVLMYSRRCSLRLGLQPGMRPSVHAFAWLGRWMSQHASLRNLIEAIPETDWTPIPYWMDGAADVAAGSQLALFATYSYHGFTPLNGAGGRSPFPVGLTVQRQLLLPVPSIILAGSPPVSDYAAGPLRCGSWGRRIPG